MLFPTKRSRFAKHNQRERLRGAATEAIAEIASSEAFRAGDVELLAREITERGCRVTGIERASIWLFDSTETVVRCIDCYEATPARHSAGMVLTEAEFAKEFRALTTAPYVNADDALADPRTAGYVEGYLKPHGITSILTAIVQSSGRQLGRLCLEQVGRVHHWEQDEIYFARQLAETLALVIVNRERGAAVEPLKPSSLQPALVIEDVPAMIAYVDSGWRYRYANLRYRAFHTGSGAAIVSKRMDEVLPPQTWEAMRGCAARALAGEVLSYRDERLLHDRRRYVSGSLVPHRDQDGAVLGIYVLENDVTTQHLAEEAMRGSEVRARSQLSLFRELLDRTADMIYVVDAQTGLVLDANDAVSRQLGYTRHELLRMKLTDFSLCAAKYSWEQQVVYARAAGSFVVEGRHRRKDGSTLPVQISLSYVEQNEARYLISVTRDVTVQTGQQRLIDRMSRVLRMQSAVSSAVLRIRDRDELLQEICRVATQLAGYDRAVVSLVEAGGRRARPRFRAGMGTDFPEPEFLDIGDETEPDTSLTSRALRTGEITVCSDLTRSEPPVAMRERLVELGFNAVLALPLIVDGRSVGALTLASRDPAFVGDDEIILLKDMSATVAFAIRSQERADAFQSMASYDPVTGLAKRPLFCERVDSMLARMAPGMRPAVAAFDVHLLSGINDTFGRRFGDLLLQNVADRLKHHAESDEHIGCLGGGVFALVEPELFTSEENINALLEQTVFGEPFMIEGREIRLSCRSGVARFPIDGQDSSTLLQNAEAALKRAKDTGEPYLHYKLEMHSEVVERLELEHRLRRAVDAQEFELHYQPQVNIATGRIEAVEALLRWNDPERGLVPPAKFLSVLESSGLIVAAGNWALERAVRDCRAWREKGLGPLRIGVNVSPLQLRRRAFVGHVLEQVGGLPNDEPGYGVDLEITESMLLQDIKSTSAKLRELRAAGVRVALDDFGTGYSSLGLLSSLPVDALKIDRSFIRGLPSDRGSVTLVRSIITLASAFGLTVVAEGVETLAQLELLREMKCEYSQGYLHHRPMTARELEQVLAG